MTKNTIDLESLRPALAEIERAIAWAYEKYAGDYLGKPVTVVIQTGGLMRKNCIGRFWSDQWSTREGDSVHEIAVSSFHLKADVLEIIHTAIHETVHLMNHEIDVKDCASNGRHNKKFKEAAEIFGLECADPANTPASIGYGRTSLTDDLRGDIEKAFKPDYDAFRIFRNGLPVKPKKEPKRNSWACECTTVLLAAKQELDATCEKCHNLFERNQSE